jgi:hypothetical protein
MTNIVNLRRARKAKARAAKEEQACQNRAQYGTPTAERKLTKARSEKSAHDLASHRLNINKPLEE